jgi:hypothetical protein
MSMVSGVVVHLWFNSPIGAPLLDQNLFGASGGREKSQGIASTIGELIVIITNP